VKQFNDLEISPRSSTIASRKGCRVAMYVKCSDDSEQKKRKSPFSTTTLSFDAPSPENPREYLHKSYTARNYVHWAIRFSRRQYMGIALQIFEQFCRKPETPTHQLPRRKQILTQNGHSRSLEVIYFGITEEPLRGYIAQYNKCGPRYEGSEDIASDSSENRHFRPPHSHLTPPLQRTPVNILIILILLETRIPGLHFCR